MTTYGVTLAGFVLKRLQPILTEIENNLKGSTQWGPTANLQGDSGIGQLNGVVSVSLAEAWELAQDVYNAFYRDSAEGAQLNNVCALIGVTRKPASLSYVRSDDQVLIGTPGTLIAAGKIVQVEGTGDQFETATAATIGAGGTVTVRMNALVAGAVTAPAGKLTYIITPVAGWTSTINNDDAVIGDPEETDPQLRQRALNSLQIAGRSTLGGIRANLAQNIEDVTDVSTVENDSDFADADGRPPHSVECIVQDGDDQEIADAILEYKAAGIQTCSSVLGIFKITKTVTDDEGGIHTIIFSRPEELDTFMHVTLIIDAAKFNSGSDQVERITVVAGIIGDVFSVTIEGVTYTYTQIGGDDAISIAAGLAVVINAGLWVSVTASHGVLDDYLDLTSDYSGNFFVLSASVTGTGTLTITTQTENGGEQETIIQSILDYAEEAQGIGDDILLSKYYNPINDDDDDNGILGITIQASITRWANTGPAGGTSNITIAAAQKAILSSTRTTIDVTT